MNKNTEKVINDAKGPFINMVTHDDGTISVKLEFYREKHGGGLESWTVQFDSLDDWSIACVGRRARLAIDEAGRKAWATNRQALKRVTGDE